MKFRMIINKVVKLVLKLIYVLLFNINLTIFVVLTLKFMGYECYKIVESYTIFP